MEERGSGWLLFASVTLILVGIMRIFDAIWAWRYHGALPDNLNGGVFGTNLHTYGWIWFIVGIVLIIAGFGVLTNSQFSRWIGLVGAAIGAITAITWMPFYPVWSFLYIIIAMMVVYALAQYGGPEQA